MGGGGGEVTEKGHFSDLVIELILTYSMHGDNVIAKVRFCTLVFNVSSIYLILPNNWKSLLPSNIFVHN